MGHLFAHRERQSSQQQEQPPQTRFAARVASSRRAWVLRTIGPAVMPRLCKGCRVTTRSCPEYYAGRLAGLQRLGLLPLRQTRKMQGRLRWRTSPRGWARKRSWSPTITPREGYKIAEAYRNRVSSLSAADDGVEFADKVVRGATLEEGSLACKIRLTPKRPGAQRCAQGRVCQQPRRRLPPRYQSGCPDRDGHGDRLAALATLSFGSRTAEASRSAFAARELAHRIETHA